ncbi:MAG: DUF2254 domain-containing protein [Solirubrobacterales bacterium]|nr:DUF2254 domain-containing protein [Solirubrobacterales bacterium]MCB0859678.1 DUF2254 domain-containing protein [Solirubrobacterales bacterium]
MKLTFAPKSWFEAMRVSFGLPSGMAMLAGIFLGLTLPAMDDKFGIELPALAFESQSSARGLLETISTATVSVAGLSFSVTIVALTLASSQLSPRVLRTFRGDRLSQVTLALFLGTFVYCLTLLVRLGVNGTGGEAPNLSVTIAVLLAFASFLVFAFFIGHVIKILQPSTVVSGIYEDGVEMGRNQYPTGAGEPDHPAAARLAARDLMRGKGPETVCSEDPGYLTLVDLDGLISCLQEKDGFARQAVAVGDYVLPGQTLVEVWPGEDGMEVLEAKVRETFVLGKQRTLVQDTAFCVRQLADIALKGLSPGINDPTTAENAMDAMCSLLINFARTERPSAVRVDENADPRFLALAPDLDDLVRLGFGQVRVAAEGSPHFNARLMVLLNQLQAQARKANVASREINRQKQALGSVVEVC